MNKEFEDISLDYPLCSRHLDEFEHFLNSKDELSERGDVLPFFRQHEQLAILIGMITQISVPDCKAWELDIFGDYRCDLAVGRKDQGTYSFIEFEDAQSESIFKKHPNKATREWGQRLDHGYSQAIDWAHQLDDLRRTHNMKRRFGKDEIFYEFMLVIGRNKHFLKNKDEPDRPKWRSDNVLVGNKKVLCITFDDLLIKLRDKHDQLKEVYEAGVAFGSKTSSPTSTSPSDPASGEPQA